MAAQDDRELFDLCSEDGAPLGRQKERALVHRDGDWHRSLHIWVVIQGESGAPELLLQRRSAGKDTWPRALDVAVAGHYRAGEALEQGLREAEEEIGLALGPKDVVRIGLRRRADRRPGIQDNELQDIFVARTSRRLHELAPFEDEVEALIALPLKEAAKLLSGEAAEAKGRELRAANANERAPKAGIARAEELIPTDDGYYAQAMRSILALIEGKTPAPWTLG
jgi:isopentenyldiphosphate isomerase